MSCMLARW